ncbi:MAG TPA: hypothetical protein PLY66_05645 [Acidobacteriota bacterium]|nr:hypothetical protein [Acidobacteriota bacterium]HQF87481.1 hypothetical protein [Acidobacteriota bacterium]HQK88263.1 hypothetical protein [Acidobacteriota bacterium]
MDLGVIALLAGIIFQWPYGEKIHRSAQKRLTRVVIPRRAADARRRQSGKTVLVPQNDPLFSGRFGVIRANRAEFRNAPTASNLQGGGVEHIVVNPERHGVSGGGHNIT